MTHRRGGRLITGESGKRNPTSGDGGSVNSTGTVAGTKAEGGGVDRRRGQDGVVGGYLGNTVAEGAKYIGEKLKESGKAAEPKAKSAWHKTRDGAADFGSSVKKFFSNLFGN